MPSHSRRIDYISSDTVTIAGHIRIFLRISHIPVEALARRERREGGTGSPIFLWKHCFGFKVRTRREKGSKDFVRKHRHEERERESQRERERERERASEREREWISRVPLEALPRRGRGGERERGREREREGGREGGREDLPTSCGSTATKRKRHTLQVTQPASPGHSRCETSFSRHAAIT